MAREINLVPDIKGEMIKTLKLRNFIFFLCIVVASASVAVTVMSFPCLASLAFLWSASRQALLYFLTIDFASRMH